MVSTLTQSVTHALVPTLTSVLFSERHQSLACANCYHHQRHCNLCRFSPANSYYDNYYSTCVRASALVCCDFSCCCVLFAFIVYCGC